MNILFFLTPKRDVDYIYDDSTLRQAMDKMDAHGHSAIPVLNRDGCYLGTISEGDILRTVKENYSLDLKAAETMRVCQIRQSRHIASVTATSRMEDLFDLACSQNFVPVVDDANTFIGLITRKDIFRHCYHEVLRLKFELRDCSEK